LAIDQAFNETVEYYDSWIRKAVPGYDDLFAVAKELIPFTPEQSVDVLDLGAGAADGNRLDTKCGSCIAECASGSRGPHRDVQ